MCNKNAPSLDSDYVVKDHLLRGFLESVGVKLSLLKDDSSDALKLSVLRVKHEVDHNMVVLKDSWKTTGCTLMAFNLNKRHKKSMKHKHKQMNVIAIYCPKGIIFVEQPEKDCQNLGYSNYEEALKRHTPSLYTSKGVRWLRNEEEICELNHIGSLTRAGKDHICLRSEIHNLCTHKSYSGGSQWAESLVDTAVKIHEYLSSVGDTWYYNVLTGKDISLDALFNKEASLLSIFLSIIQHDPEKQSFTDLRLGEDDIEAITNGSKFWSESRQLGLILHCVLKVADVMDTLVPTAGYFDMALDKVKNIIESHRLQLGEDALQFWQELKSSIEVSANVSMFPNRSSRLAASCLNPVYFLQQVEKDNQLPADELKTALKDLEETQREEQEDIDKEVERYSELFRSLSERIKLEDHHPVKLWEEHGRDLPVLRRCALELLSRPLSCLGKQVKEHLYQLQGADDYILRLNFRMMSHFQHLGDDIYKPLDLSQLDYENIKQYIVTDEADSEQSENSEQSD